MQKLQNPVKNSAKIIVIIGSTASGKTYLAHTLFCKLKEKKINCEILNLDAFQMYEELNIGTAKPSTEDIQNYSYHGIDLCPIHANLDAEQFAKFAHKSCAEIISRKHVPLCVGGSGLYLRAFLHGLDPLPGRNEKIRQKIREYAEINGWQKCHDWLNSVDPIRAQEIHPNDKVRIERALEIYEITGKPVSDSRSKTAELKKQSSLYNPFVIHTEIEKSDYEKRLKLRTEQLLASGWIDEVKKIYTKHGIACKEFNSMRAIGYNDILDFLLDNNSQPSFEKLTEKIFQSTKMYAKRQRTWNQKEICHFKIDPTDSIKFKILLEDIVTFIK